MLGEHVYCVAVTLKMTDQVQQWICIKIALSLHIPRRNYWDDSEGCSYRQLVISSLITTTHPLMYHISCRVFGETSNHQVTQSPYNPDLVPCNFWLFLKLKLPLKGKRFQTIDENWENTMGKLMETGRTVWGPKVHRHLEGDYGATVLCIRVLVSCIFFNKCLCFSYYVTVYLLDRPCIYMALPSNTPSCPTLC